MLAIGITRDVPAVSWFKSEYPSDELVILSGTLRFTTDTFNEYQDAEILFVACICSEQRMTPRKVQIPLNSTFSAVLIPLGRVSAVR